MPDRTVRIVSLGPSDDEDTESLHGGLRPVTEGQWTVITVYHSDRGGSGDGPVEPGTGRVSTGLPNPVGIMSLPMPGSLVFPYAADWTVDSTSVFEQLFDGLVNDESDSVLDDLAGVTRNRLTQFGSSTAFRLAVQNRGLAHNPQREFFYNSPQFRTFTFEWKVTPKNRRDADALEELERVCTEYMHPDYVDGTEGGVWDLPGLFEVDFVNARVPSIEPCVLANFSVDQTATGAGWHAHPDGEPVSTRVSMTFQEIEPLTRTKIREKGL